MNQSLVEVALFVRDLLGYDESLIKIGRDNDTITEFTVGYIGVDTLGSARRLASSKTYDGVTEVMTYSQRWSIPIVLSFYGTLAWNTATTFSLLIKSQSSLELQQAQGIGVHQVSELTDVKVLTGQQFGERIELNFNLHYTTSADVDTLRIDTAQISILTEQGLEIEP